MKTQTALLIVMAAGILGCVLTTTAAPLSAEIKPAPILDVMQRVADWQLAHSNTNAATSWIQAAEDAGMMALAGISGDVKYRDAMLALGEANNDMYRTMNLFDTKGPSQDDYKVGKTSGDGGLGIWSDGKLYVSKNWRSYKIITTGPIRSEFELTYDAWDAGDGRMVPETKRISIDAGSNLSRVESTFSSDDKSPLQIGVGLAERPGENVVVLDGSPEIDSWQTSMTRGLAVEDKNEGWMTYWQPRDFTKGVTAVAVVLPKGSIETFTNDVPDLPASALKPPTHALGEGQPATRDLLAVAPAEIGQPFVYYFGAGWDKSGDFPNAKSWNDYVRRFAERRDQPLKIMVGN